MFVHLLTYSFDIHKQMYYEVKHEQTSQRFDLHLFIFNPNHQGADFLLFGL